jgi:hypothetical protein
MELIANIYLLYSIMVDLFDPKDQDSYLILIDQQDEVTVSVLKLWNQCIYYFALHVHIKLSDFLNIHLDLYKPV